MFVAKCLPTACIKTLLIAESQIENNISTFEPGLTSQM